MSDFGITVYRTKCRGFFGKVKSFCEDFVVHEIDENGKIQSLQQSSKANLQFQVTSDSSTKNENSNTLCTHCSYTIDAKSAEEIISDLSSIVGQHTYGNLLTFADQAVNCRSKVIGDYKRFHLGVINEKNKRRTVHQCIGHLFPRLRTMLERKENDILMSVELDPNYLPIAAELPEVEIDEFLRFVRKCCTCKNNSSHVIEVAGIHKDQRKRIHHTIGKLFGAFLESKTFIGETNNEKNRIVVRYRRKQICCNKSRCNIIKAPFYVQFIMKKSNIETLDAIHRIARAAGVHISDFSYAGIKDCRAVTYQRVAVRNVTAHQMFRVGEKFRTSQHESIRCGDYQVRNTPIKVGELSGNRFHIVVRGISLQKAGKYRNETYMSVIKSIEHVKYTGFVNYYGGQRFGKSTAAVHAYDVGQAMLRNDAMTAIEIMLSTVDEAVDSKAVEAFKYYQSTGDVAGTLSRMPWCKTREVLALKALHRYGKSSDGYKKALLNIPHNMRMLYIHSYCSLVWNQAVSYRLERYGFDVVPGDLVLMTADDTGNSVSLKQDQSQCIHIVTSEDTVQKKYSIDDMVMPLPGAKILYPTNSSGQIYQDVFLKDDIDISSCFINVDLNFNIKGAYRKIISYPKDVIYSVHELDCTHLHVRSHHCCQQLLENESDDGQCKNRDFHLKLEMTLDPGCYALMCLRELTKCKMT